jgi:hypothetical protein
MQVEYAYSDDYAVLVSGNLNFYYGYEVTDENDDWCFQVKKNGQEIFKISSDYIIKNIDGRQLEYPKDFLTAGIGVWLLFK